MSKQLLRGIKMYANYLVPDNEIWASEKTYDEYAKHLAAQKKEACRWKEDDDGLWNTKCGNEFYLADGCRVEENGIKYCPYCGRIIRVAQR